MVDRVGELGDVQIHHPVLALFGVPLGRYHGIVRAAPRSKPVAVLAEPRLEDRPHHLPQQLLDEPIQHRRDAPLSDAPAGHTEADSQSAARSQPAWLAEPRALGAARESPAQPLAHARGSVSAYEHRALLRRHDRQGVVLAILSRPRKPAGLPPTMYYTR